jgi:hypothetical protein
MSPKADPSEVVLPVILATVRESRKALMPSVGMNRPPPWPEASVPAPKPPRALLAWAQQRVRPDGNYLGWARLQAFPGARRTAGQAGSPGAGFAVV